MLGEGEKAAGEAQGVLRVTNLEGGGHEVEGAAGRHCEVVNVSVVELRRAEVVRPEGLRAAKRESSKTVAGNPVVVDLSGATGAAVDGEEEARRGAESDEVLLGNHLRAELRESFWAPSRLPAPPRTGQAVRRGRCP